jgi:hypothetical protein
MTDDKILDLFGTFLNKVVEYNTQAKIHLELMGKDVGGLKEQIGQSDKTVMGLLHQMVRDGGTPDEIKKFVETYTKRNYTDDEIKGLGRHVEQVDEMHKFAMKLKGRLAITAAVIAAFVAIMTLGEKALKLWEYLLGGGV